MCPQANCFLSMQLPPAKVGTLGYLTFSLGKLYLAYFLTWEVRKESSFIILAEGLVFYFSTPNNSL